MTQRELAEMVEHIRRQCTEYPQYASAASIIDRILAITAGTVKP